MYINTVKSVNAVNYYLYESYRNEKGQSRSRIVEKLGNVDEIKRKFNVTDVDAWCKEYAKQRTAEAKKASLKNNRKLTVVFEEGKDYCWEQSGSAFNHDLFSEVPRLSESFKTA